MAIANLEIRTTDLLAVKAELERQQEEEKLEIEVEVLNLLIGYGELARSPYRAER